MVFEGGCAIAKIYRAAAYAGVFWVALSVSQTSATASTITIDFEDVGVFSVFALPAISSRGFYFTSNVTPGLGTLFNGNPCGPNCAANETTTLTVSGFGAGVGGGGTKTQPVRLTSTLGLPFRLFGLEVATITDSVSINADRIKLTGNLLNGGTIVQIVPINIFSRGPGGHPDFQAADLNSIWISSQLTSVDFQGTFGPNSFFNEGFSLDNVQVDVVPEPATLLLLSAGLLGLLRLGKSGDHCHSRRPRNGGVSRLQH